MNKISTQSILQGLKKISLIAVFAFAITANQAFTIYNSTNNPAGLQVKIVKCYPNPAVSFINFELSSSDITSKNYSLQVYSFTGKKMYESNISNLKITLTFTNDFYRGIYVYQLRDKSGRILETGKFQVVK